MQSEAALEAGVGGLAEALRVIIGSVSQTIFAEDNNFSVRYNGDYIETAVYTDLGHYNVAEFMLALDRDLKEAREEAIQCYINLRGSDD